MLIFPVVVDCTTVFDVDRCCECSVFYIHSVKFCLTGCQFGGLLVDLIFLHGGCVATAGRVYSSRAPIDTLNRFESPC